MRRTYRLPDAPCDRSAEQIAELQHCYWCWLLTKDDRNAALALLVLKLDRDVAWSVVFDRLVFLIGFETCVARLGAEAALAWPERAKDIAETQLTV